MTRIVASPTDLASSILTAWQTNNRVTTELILSVPAALWNLPVADRPQRMVRTVAAHLHNARCGWVRTLGQEHGVPTPARVDYRRVTPRQLATALKRSGQGIENILKLGLASNGRVPPSKGYVWRNLALDVAHVLTYFVAHEAHHRGQMVLLARQSGYRLPGRALVDLWQWKEKR